MDCRRPSCGSDVSSNVTMIYADQGGGSRLGGSMGGSSTGMLQELYLEMEPQISKSYRPHVTYTPPSKPSTAQIRLRDIVDKRKSKLNATKLMMQAVSEMKRKRALAVTKHKDAEKETKDKDMEETPIGVSQSLPNLASNNSS